VIRKGDEMSVVIFVFIACIVAMFGAIWIYNKSEDTAYASTVKKLQSVEADLKQANTQWESAKNIALQQGLKITELESKVTCAQDELKKFKVEIDNLQDHCARIREQQIQLKDQLANKRPVLKVQQPIPVQVVDPKLMNKVKKQMKEVSQ